MKLFLCHSGRDSEFVSCVAAHLKRHQPLLDYFCYEEHQQSDESFLTRVQEEIRNANAFVIFVNGATYPLSRYQQAECINIQKRLTKSEQKLHCFVIALSNDWDRCGLDNFPDDFEHKAVRIFAGNWADTSSARTCAMELVSKLHVPWVDDAGLPANPNLFSYEKDIISHYADVTRIGVDASSQASGDPDTEVRQEIIRGRIRDGCPPRWPNVVDLTHDDRNILKENPLDWRKIGQFRPRDSIVLASAVHPNGEVDSRGFGFPEAGPRERLLFPLVSRKTLHVGILVSGGLAPGINAVIDGIVQRHWKYAESTEYELDINGFVNGFHAFRDDAPSGGDRISLVPNRQSKKQGAFVTADHVGEGGSILGTFREDLLLEPSNRASILRGYLQGPLGNIDILYVIGGDGSMKAAHALYSVASEIRNRNRPLSVVAIPKTMDNDILWMWQSFGFLSAVDKARETVEQLHTEIQSNPRVCVMQLFGSDSGYVVSHAVLASASGHCDIALIPEVDFSLLGVAQHLAKRIAQRKEGPLPKALIVMSETAVPVDASWYLQQPPRSPPETLPEQLRDLLSGFPEVELTRSEKKAIEKFDAERSEGKRLTGQTSDELRKASLKIMVQGLTYLLPRLQPSINHMSWNHLRFVISEPRHLLRTIRPSTSDVIMGQRLGTLAVDNAMAGYTDFMISQWLTEFVLVPLPLVVLGRKRIPKGGIFWKSVLAKTGQESNLIAPWPRPEWLPVEDQPD